MEILGYGEDAVTLWAVTKRLPVILQMLGDASTLSKCRTFFRPSFGRRGGASSPQFGEFDFIILAERILYLGESKWDRSPEQVREGAVRLAERQVLRHKVFKLYVELWCAGNHPSWGDFVLDEGARQHFERIKKPIAPAGSLLASNLETVLSTIRDRYGAKPTIRNVLLYLRAGAQVAKVPAKAPGDFQIVALDYSEDALDAFVSIRL